MFRPHSNEQLDAAHAIRIMLAQLNRANGSSGALASLHQDWLGSDPFAKGSSDRQVTVASIRNALLEHIRNFCAAHDINWITLMSDDGRLRMAGFAPGSI